MVRHEAVFRFRSGHAKNIYAALLPELPDDVNPRSSTRCSLEGDDLLVLTINAQDAASLRAALNMYLRLVNVADEVVTLVEKP